jgi:predicted  nucleic acid-binding Zn-ribbon protein
MTQSMGTLRSAPTLRRKRGLGGDVRYVFTAVMGVREFRRELAHIEARQVTRQTSRRHHLLTLGRSAVVVETYDHPALTQAREDLDSIEDTRARNAGLVTAADLELDRVRRDRDAAAKQFLVDAAATDAELAELAKKLEPLEKEAASVRKRVTELQESLKRIDKKIAATEANLESPKPKQDRAAIQADIATLKADRVAIKRDEPVIAGELDALAPRIAAYEASRTDAQRRRRDLDKAELDDQRRSEELMAAIGAKRKVVDRAAAEAEAERDRILFELGERLYVDRPRTLRPQLAPIEDIDLELGTGDRRIMELRELIASVDKMKLARGIAVIAVAALAVIALVTLIIIKLV